MGFTKDIYGKPISSRYILPKGSKVDRFGSEYGRFVSPIAAPYNQRSIPPSSLNHNPDKTLPFDYHMYETTEDLVVESGPAAAWFGQPGQGVQYLLDVSIKMLLGRKALRPIDLSNFHDIKDPNAVHGLY